jgi:hypothetical protein
LYIFNTVDKIRATIDLSLTKIARLT